MVQSNLSRRMSGLAPSPRGLTCPSRAFSVDLANRPKRSDLWRLTVKPEEEEEEDVIDLGAPRTLRAAPCLVGAAPRDARSRTYTPNPRLYPGPQKPQKRQAKVKQKRKPRHNRKNVYRRPVPNSRLYRPGPPRRPPPPANPRAAWQPPVQGNLETASRVALRLNQATLFTPNRSESKKTSVHTILGVTPAKTVRKRSPIRKRPSSPPSRLPKVVIKLPAAAGDGNPTEGPRYRPASQHFRDRQLGSRDSRDSTPTGGRVILISSRGIMDATPRHSTSPEDCSDGNDSQSAPSEFLAEFLSAIMRRQYAEALKYCRLILQYEPRNATARGFFPLLQQKLAQQTPRDTSDKPTEKPRTRHQRSRASRSPELGDASSAGYSGGSSPIPTCLLPNDVMEQEADSLSCSDPRPGSAASSDQSEPEQEPDLGSVSSQSSLELDSSPARSSPSLSLSRRTDSASASGTWDSSGSGPRDDNGNPAPAPAHTSAPKSYACDAENNQPAPAAVRSPRRAARAPRLTLQSEPSTESLRRLRAQFACSIK